MEFRATELQRNILRIVSDLQFGKQRKHVRDGSPVVLGGASDSIIRAELRESGDDPIPEGEVDGVLEELATRRLLDRLWVDNASWPQNLKYKRPDGRVVSTTIGQGYFRKVFLDDECVAEEWTEGDPNPTGRFAWYRITQDGVAALESAGGEAAPNKTPPVWKPSPGYVGTKTIGYLERFKKGGKNPVPSTIHRWVERDKKAATKSGREPVKIERAPDTHMNHYPESWVLEQIKLWNPRQPSRA